MKQQLTDQFALVSDQVTRLEIEIVLRELSKAIHQTTSAAIVEFGCYTGTTSLFMSRLLNIHKSTREFHVYDSFEGLPEKGRHDVSPVGDQFRPGELRASKKQFIENYKKASLVLPHIHKGWFHELDRADVPEKIAFAFLDGDYYESIAISLQLVWPRLVSGAIVIVDDYANEALPGAAKAVDEWVRTHTARLQVEHSLAILRP